MKKRFLLILLTAAMLLTACGSKRELNYYSFDAGGNLLHTTVEPVGKTLVDHHGDSIGTLIGREDKSDMMLCYNATDAVLAMIHVPYVVSASVQTVWSMEHDVFFFKPHTFFYLTDEPDYMDCIPEQMQISGQKQTIRILAPASVLLRDYVREFNRSLPQKMGDGLLIQRMAHNGDILIFEIMMYEVSAHFVSDEDIRMFREEERPYFLQGLKEWIHLQRDAALIRELACPVEYRFVDKNSQLLTTLRFDPSEL